MYLHNKTRGGRMVGGGALVKWFEIGDINVSLENIGIDLLPYRI